MPVSEFAVEAALWRDAAAPCEWKGRTIYTGISFDGTYYATDERDCLPPDLVSFYVLRWQGINLDGSEMTTHGEELQALLNACRLTESTGRRVCVSVGVFEYESELS